MGGEVLVLPVTRFTLALKVSPHPRVIFTRAMLVRRCCCLAAIPREIACAMRRLIGIQNQRLLAGSIGYLRLTLSRCAATIYWAWP